MRQYLSFSATREVAEAGVQVALPLRRMHDIARQSLVNVGGVPYPNLQRSSMWTFCEQVDDGVVFTFDRSRPLGDVRFAKDLSFVATREPTDEEAETPIIYLEALTWEFVATLRFFDRIVAALSRPGMFRIGLGLSGFSGALVDWAGFYEEPNQSTLSNYRFSPASESVVYECPGISFPLIADKPTFIQGVAEVVLETSFSVRGMRRTALERSESRLLLAKQSVVSVVESALQNVLGGTP